LVQYPFRISLGCLKFDTLSWGGVLSADGRSFDSFEVCGNL
jgi:hypothetical protein